MRLVTVTRMPDGDPERSEAEAVLLEVSPTGDLLLGLDDGELLVFDVEAFSRALDGERADRSSSAETRAA